MKKLFISGNYLIVVDGNGYSREFAVKNTIYAERKEQFLIQEGNVDLQEILIPVADAENWVNDLSVPFTAETMRTYLRENTGNFSSASGGSGAGAGYENVLNHTLTPNEIVGLTLTPFEVIPQPLQSAIFDFKIVFRFVSGTGAYGGGGLDLLLINSNPYFTIPTQSVIAINSAMIQELKDGGTVIYGNHSADVAGFEQITPQPIDNRFLLTTNGVQITLPFPPLVGGNLYIDVYYNIIPIQ